MNVYDDAISAALTGWLAPRPIPLPALAVDAVLSAQGVRLVGWSLRETSLNPATVDLYTGGGTNGTRVASLTIAAGGSSVIAIPDGGVLCESGLFIEIVSGTLTGAVWVRFPAPRLD